MHSTTHKNPRHGFTLIELSIVLVIIGLIVGGVLVGQDLIKAAEIRATIGQLEKYNSAVNTFRGKFGGIPGDLQASKAAGFGMFQIVGGTGPLGVGDGNGLLQGDSTAITDATITYGIGEPLVFWRHLSEANLVDGAFGSASNSNLGATSGTGAVGTAVTNVVQSLPPAKMGRGNYLAVYAFEGSNHYELNSIQEIETDGTYTTQSSSQMTPREAFNIDSKLDDGMPNTGNVVARFRQTGGGALNQGFGADVTCVTGTTATNTYVLSSETPTCALRTRFN